MRVPTVLLLVAVAGCMARNRPPEPLSTRMEVETVLARFSRAWLAPARIAPPAVSFEPRTATDGTVTATVRPLRPEDAAWNHWPSGSRLFNNRAALLFEVTLSGRGPVRWVAEGTRLELNVAGNPLRPATTPDALLTPLVEAALLQEEWALEGDLVDRTRAAGPFRAAYLPTAALAAPSGVVAFPLPEPELHVIALRLTLQVADDDGMHFFSWFYD